jgi:hypothetical protein
VVNGLAQDSGAKTQRPSVAAQTLQKACEFDRSTLQANQTTLEISIATQNASLEALRTAAAQRAANGAKAVLDASKQAGLAATKAQRLAGAARRGEMASDTDALILESLK